MRKILRLLVVGFCLFVLVALTSAGALARPVTSTQVGLTRGTCQAVGGHALSNNAQVNNIYACGPLGGLWLIRYFPGAWGEMRFQCVEYAMRYMYLHYHIKPYLANGGAVIANYSRYAANQQGAVGLKVIPNGTHRIPLKGDIIGFWGPATLGHVAVVSSALIDHNGNGSVTIVEQNAARTGIRNIPVTGWNIAYSNGLLTPR